jgi:hypothetical protein
MKGFRLIIQVWTRLAWVVSCWDEWTGDSTISTRIAGKQAHHFTTFIDIVDQDTVGSRSFCLSGSRSGIIDPDLDPDQK